jgi:hypothetical protein
MSWKGEVALKLPSVPNRKTLPMEYSISSEAKALLPDLRRCCAAEFTLKSYKKDLSASEDTRDFFESLQQEQGERGLLADEEAEEPYSHLNFLAKQREYVINLVHVKFILAAIQKKHVQLATQLAELLPPMSETEVRPNHIYRGGLARNLYFGEKRPDENGFYVQNIAWNLDFAVDFTGISTKKNAWPLAREGFFRVPVGRRKDAIVIEIPFSYADTPADIPQYEQRHSFEGDAFKNKPIKLYRPV